MRIGAAALQLGSHLIVAMESINSSSVKCDKNLMRYILPNNREGDESMLRNSRRASGFYNHHRIESH